MVEFFEVVVDDCRSFLLLVTTGPQPTMVQRADGPVLSFHSFFVHSKSMHMHRSASGWTISLCFEKDLPFTYLINYLQLN